MIRHAITNEMGDQILVDRSNEDGSGTPAIVLLTFVAAYGEMDRVVFTLTDEDRAVLARALM